MELLHPFHDHPLIPSDIKHDDPLLSICEACRAPILAGPDVFICSSSGVSDECKFVLHKSCAELPMEITHSLHTQHPLTLYAKDPNPPNRYASCNDCGDPLYGFVYHCSICKFDLHVTCARNLSLIHKEKKRVRGDMNQLEHPAHEHPLIQCEKENDDKRYTCYGCGDALHSAPFFLCSHEFCRFALHRYCALLPNKISHFLHTQHPLILYRNGKQHEYRRAFCGKCRVFIAECFLYHCPICKFDLHLKCAQLPQDVKCQRHEEKVDSITGCNSLETSREEIEVELRHPFHYHHMLILSQQVYNTKKQICDGCSSPVLPGPFFTCSQQQSCHFSLHIHCANLPDQITHFSHKMHPITLLQKHPYIPEHPNCDSCGGSIRGFLYHCSFCGYNLDTQCASRRPFLDSEEDHQHFFILLKVTMFTCDICGISGHDRSYVCITCQIQIHQSCAVLPRTVRVKSHHHQLKLTFGFQLEAPIDPIRRFCRICRAGDVDTEYGFYYCAHCNYIVDLICGASKTYREYRFDDENFTDNVVDLKRLHSHGLIMYPDDEPEDTIPKDVCDVCLLPLTTSIPFYKCEEENCGFFVHQSCATLPERVYHPLHQTHQAIFSYDQVREVRWCSACELPFNGFSYQREKEEEEGSSNSVSVDVKCGMRSDVIKIEKAHPHPLRVMTVGKDETVCVGCGLYCKKAKYTCAQCDYNVCFKCIGLPASAKHWWDEHPLELTYESTEHESGEYYCDECELPRRPNHWFYHCESCERDVHPGCLTLHNMNSKITVKREEHPLHPLILAIDQIKTPPVCANCGHQCRGGVFLQCADCKFYLHFDSIFCNYAADQLE